MYIRSRSGPDGPDRERLQCAWIAGNASGARSYFSTVSNFGVPSSDSGSAGISRRFLAPSIKQSPSKITPSATTSRGAAILPVTRAGASNSTFSLAATSPSTLPRITTTSPAMLARISAPSPMLSVPPRQRISPLTLPSISAVPITSSFPVTRLPLKKWAAKSAAGSATFFTSVGGSAIRLGRSSNSGVFVLSPRPNQAKKHPPEEGFCYNIRAMRCQKKMAQKAPENAATPNPSLERRGMKTARDRIVLVPRLRFPSSRRRKKGRGELLPTIGSLRAREVFGVDRIDHREGVLERKAVRVVIVVDVDVAARARHAQRELGVGPHLRLAVERGVLRGRAVAADVAEPPQDGDVAWQIAPIGDADGPAGALDRVIDLFFEPALVAKFEDDLQSLAAL